jgi:hypothetical protein
VTTVASIVVGAVLLTVVGLGPQSQDRPASEPSIFDETLDQSSRVVVPVSDLDTSQKFYEKFGFKVQKEGRVVVATGGGLSLLLVPTTGFTPSNYPIAVWRIRDVNPAMHARDSLNGPKDVKLPDGIEFFRSFGAPTMGLPVKDPDGHILAFVKITQ